VRRYGGGGECGRWALSPSHDEHRQVSRLPRGRQSGDAVDEINKLVEQLAAIKKLLQSISVLRVDVEGGGGGGELIEKVKARGNSDDGSR
jgi:hypothetical protein